MVGSRCIAMAAGVWFLALTFTIRAETPTAVPARAAQSAPAEAQAAPANADCLACHEDDSAARADGTPVVVKAAVFEGSIHGSFSCVDCHADLATTAEWPHPEKLAPVDCATCHTDPVEQYKQSEHAKAREAGSAAAATCADCHGAHDILPAKDPKSKTYHLNVAATCSRCHGDDELVREGKIPADMTHAFADSIHGRALSQSGLVVAPTCSDCHGAHDIRPPGDPSSRVAIGNVPATCGQCHQGIQHQFEAGVHGQLLARGTDGAPACQTCHTAHSIQRGESVGWQLSVIGQCGTCHADRMATFRDTFHGQVTSLGFRTVAGCADCHGAHEVLPAGDPRSPIAPANLVKTCGKCHEGANENFVQYDPHADKSNRARSAPLYYTSKFMTVLLLGVFAFFGLHTSLWFGKEWRVRRARQTARRRPSRSSRPGGGSEGGGHASA